MLYPLDQLCPEQNYSWLRSTGLQTPPLPALLLTQIASRHHGQSMLETGRASQEDSGES